MYKGKTFIAIIPARGGSKRLPRKNIINFNEKPLLAWSIEAALRSQYIDKVLVSSDDDEIINIAERYGSSVLKRPAELATDTATSFDVIKHAINSNKNYDYVVLLQPTSPLRTTMHIDESIDMIIRKKSDAVVSVCEVDHSPLWSNKLPYDLNMNSFLKDEIKNKRSQELDIYYRLNGAIYIIKKNTLLKEKTFMLKDNIYAYIMDRKSSVDIDNKIDLKLAEILIKEENA